MDREGTLATSSNLQYLLARFMSTSSILDEDFIQSFEEVKVTRG